MKPMNCPMHCLIFRSRQRSYRELPLRLFELGTVYRYERAGTLHGLMRIRGFTQDDSHIFCTPEQAADEIASLLDFVLSVLRAFGFDDFTFNLSTKDPNKYVGSDEDWEAATDGAALGARPPRPRVLDQGGRRRLLRPEDRHRRPRRHRPLVAAVDDPVRLQPPGALRARVRRRRQRPPPADHAAPRPVRVGRAVLRRAARALRRRLPDVAGAGAGARAAGRHGARGVRRQGRRPRSAPPAAASTSSAPATRSASASAPPSWRSCRTSSSSATTTSPPAPSASTRGASDKPERGVDLGAVRRALRRRGRSATLNAAAEAPGGAGVPTGPRCSNDAAGRGSADARCSSACGTAGGRRTSRAAAPPAASPLTTWRGPGSVFSRILRSGLPDEETHIVHRGEHVLRHPQRLPVLRRPPARAAVPRGRRARGRSTPDEAAELWATVTDAVVALKRAYRPEGINVGVNLGQPGRRQRQRAPARPRRAALDRRRQLHDRHRQHAHAARGAARHAPPRCARPGRRTAASVAWTAMTRLSDDHRDELPDDLDAAGYVGPYQFPDNSRRRIPGVIYLVIAAVCVAVWLRRAGLVADRQRRVAVGGAAADRRRRDLDHVGLADARRRDARRWSPPSRRSASRSATRRRSRCGAACAAGRRGGCCATRSRTRPCAAGSCSSTPSTAGRRAPRRGQPRARSAARRGVARLMRIAVGTDEVTAVTEAVERHLVEAGHEVVDVGHGDAVAGGRPRRSARRSPAGAPTAASCGAGPAPGCRSPPTRCRACAPRCAPTPRRPRGARKWNDANVAGDGPAPDVGDRRPSRSSTPSSPPTPTAARRRNIAEDL